MVAMSTTMASFSPPTSFSFTCYSSSSSSLSSLSPHSKLNLLCHKNFLTLRSKKNPSLLKVSSDNGVGTTSSGSAAISVEQSPPEPSFPPPQAAAAVESAVGTNASVGGAAVTVNEEVKEVVSGFVDPRWVGGTWDLKQFQKNGSTDWDAVIDAEARRRKWLEDYPESSSNENPVLFDTSIIPWWAWMKRFHLPEAELLNGRAAMIGFFMAYFVDSLTGVGPVDQTGNFFCKTLLLIAVVGVLLIRKNEDIDNLKKLVEETTFYDKQWQATWQDENSSTSKKE